MRTKSTRNLHEKQIAERAAYLLDLGKYKFANILPKDLPVKKILQLSADAWGCSEESFQGKIDHKSELDKVRKKSFLSACYLFSNEDTSKVAPQFGMTRQMGNSCRNCTQYHLKWDNWKYCDPITKLFVALNKALPTRLENLYKVNLSMVEGVSEWNGPVLTAYQISKMPVRDLAWFYNDHQCFTMLCYNQNKHTEMKYIIWKRTADHITLHALQDQGYRFCRTLDTSRYDKAHPICDRCLVKNDCSSRGRGMYYHHDTKPDFDCFENVPDSPLKVDLSLCYPLQLNRLQ